jgi:hypothetical protein
MSAASITAVLDFQPADAVVDPYYPLLYMTDLLGKRLVAVNYLTGASRTISFDMMPESLELGRGPFNDQLYVALLERFHEYVWPDQRGTIAIVDLPTFTVVDSFEVSVDPYDLAATDEGVIFVSGGSNQWTEIKSYDILSGGFIDEADIRQQCQILRHPDFDRLYVMDTDSAPRSLFTFNYDGGFFVSPVWPSGRKWPYHGDYPLYLRNVVDPTGLLLINGAGTIVSLSPDPAQDMTYAGTLGWTFQDAAFEPSGAAFYSVGNDGMLRTLVGSSPFPTEKGLPRRGRLLFVTPDGLVIVSGGDKYPPHIMIEQRIFGPMRMQLPTYWQDLAPTGDIVLPFNRPIQAGNGLSSVELTDTSGSEVPATVRLEGDRLIVTPSQALAYNSEYIVFLPADSVVAEGGDILYTAYAASFVTRPYPGDVDRDDAVAMDDIWVVAVLQGYGLEGVDLNGDGVVDIKDLVQATRNLSAP